MPKPTVTEAKGQALFWSCGCITWRDGEIFYILPCSDDCQVLQEVTTQTRQQGKELIHMPLEAG